MLNRQRRWFLTVLVATGILFLAGCSSSIRIADINSDPGRYAGKDVTITGNTANAFAALGNGVYQVDDGSGTMWVFSQSGVPNAGVKVTVTGRVEQGFSFGGRNYGMILRETEPRR
jgi:hypothetical protein